MNQTHAFLLGVLTVILGVTTAHASGFDCTADLPASQREKLLGNVESRYGEIKTLSADFIQSSYFAGLDRNEVSNGTVAFETPGKMDWRYENPKESRFVADGKTLWFFQPTENQVTLADFSQSFSSDLPVSFLLGIGKVTEKFTLKKACNTSTGVMVELIPKKSDPGLERFLLLVDKGSFNPLGARVLDVGGNETTITLAKLKLNESLGSSHFVVDLPRGVDIIDRRNRASEPGVITEKSVSPTEAHE